MDLSDVKMYLNKRITYKDTVYILTGCILRKNQNGFYYQAEIKCINANSIVICRLEDVKEYGTSKD